LILNSFPKYIIFAGFFTLLVIISCRKDNDYYEGKVNFSTDTDTLSFDTVFTKVGSSTLFFKIYNNEKQPLQVDIALKNNNEQFRINVDGVSGRSFTNVEIPANDSIYVFVETTVNPDAPISSSPFIIEEQVLIKQGDQEKTVLLVANGQNANYIPRVNGKGLISYLSCDLNKIKWDDAKPYVIYGILVIDSCELVIPEGTKIYVHGGLAKNENQFYNDGQIIVLSKGKLNIKGSAQNKVVIQGDRLEKEFKEDAGQWGGIRIFSGSKNNIIEHAIIKNSIVGISLDSASSLDIRNCIIEQTSGYGIVANHANIYGDNLLIYGTASNALAIGYGGTYEFNYCSFSTDINQDESVFFNNYKCTDPLCSGKIYSNDLKFKMSNSIIAGGSEDELAIDPLDKEKIGTSAFDIEFKNCIVRVKDLLKEKAFPNFFDYCKDCYNLKFNDKLFLNKNENDYRLDTISVALEKALPISTIPNDLLGKMRSNEKPDLGCYEF
jgi:hypothetical protein